MKFARLRKFLSDLAMVKLDQIIFEISNTDEFKELVISLNTEEQLFDKGIDARGLRLDTIGGSYAPFTIQKKKSLGQPIDRVTLKDTGEFYDSYMVEVFVGGFIINADPIKEDTNLLVEWGEDIIGLTEESKKKVMAFYKEALIIRLKKEA